MSLEKKVLEEKHRAVSDPEVIRRNANLQKFDILMANPSLRPRDLDGAALVRVPAAAPAIQPIIIQQPPVNEDRIRELQNKLSGVESENKKLEEQIKTALILENPRLMQAFYPVNRPIYNPKALLNAALEAELDKTRQDAYTLAKLRDVYGEDAAAKYLERSLSRIPQAYQAPVYKEPTKKPVHRARSRSRSRSPKSKSKPKTKVKSKRK